MASASLPTSAPFSVIEAAGWLDSSSNSCLASEAAWRPRRAGPGAFALQPLPLLMNSPDQSTGATALDVTGSGGDLRDARDRRAQPASPAYILRTRERRTSSPVSGPSASRLRCGARRRGREISPESDGRTYSAGEYWSSSTASTRDTIQEPSMRPTPAGVTAGIYSFKHPIPRDPRGRRTSGGIRRCRCGSRVSRGRPPSVQRRVSLPAPTILPLVVRRGPSGYSTQYRANLFARRWSRESSRRPPDQSPRRTRSTPIRLLTSIGPRRPMCSGVDQYTTDSEPTDSLYASDVCKILG